MELSKEQQEFLKECEEEFQHRYTDADEDFLKTKLSTSVNPPIFDLSVCSTRNKTRPKNQRRGKSQGMANIKETKKYIEGTEEQSKEAKIETTKKEIIYKDNRRTADRKRYNDRRRKDKYRRRSRDRDRGYRRDNYDDRRRNRDHYRDVERSKDRSTRSERYVRKHETKEKNAQKNINSNSSSTIPEETYPRNNQHNEQDICNMYVSKRHLYENYRPYF